MTDASAADQDQYRLPRTVSPRRYELTITPDLGAATFTGEEWVEVEVHEPVDQVVLNAADLAVTRARLVPPRDDVVEGGKKALDGQPSLDPETERLTVALPEAASPGTWYLSLEFSGTINDKLAGFYRSTFTGDDGTQRTLAVTQFEATDARRAFPCWDEPDRKAVFALTLMVADGLRAIANTTVAQEAALPGGWRRFRFADTMPMSTYLVAWVVGPLRTTAPVTVDGVPLRVVHVPGKADLTSFALEVGAHALRFFAEWFGIPYPGDKLDLIAIPDFAFGAMENLGAVTFRESVLLVDPASASRLELERVADVICHEIAHMWFGDLVTMRWWNGLWLNEAFATYMEIVAVDAFRPEWQRWVSFGRSRAAALATDGLSTTRPIEYPVHRPEDAEGMFDVLTYEKGASVLRMLERYLGTRVFRTGIRRYLDAHRHANAETTDLWDAIEDASGEPVRATMDSWIFQGGYPLVTVSATDRGVHLDQRPFHYLPSEADPGRPSAIGADWRVPVLLRGRAGGKAVENRVLLDPGGATFPLPGPAEWVVANAGGHGFYRVAYEGGLAARLTATLTDLDALERFNLVSDTWAGVLAGVTPCEDLVSLLGMLGTTEEADPDVWSVALAALNLLDRVVGGGDRLKLQAFVRSLVTPAFSRVGWEPAAGEDERLGTLRAVLLGALGTLGADPGVRDRATQLHADALAGQATIPPDLAPAVVASVAASGGAEEWAAFLERYRHPATPQEEQRYLFALADFEDDDLVKRTLELCVTEVRTQNAPYVIGRLLANRRGGATAWSFLTRRWDELLARFPDNSIPRMLDNVALLLQHGLSGEVHDFFATHTLHSGQRTLDQALERLDVNTALARREGDRLGQALTPAVEEGP